ncbi:hypothetical protein F5876DRAFT_84438 [Lentinula aff. lateritia]|uniref:Uncharacterized protein n=1 Tax=Lentinula aff. lateritia TaxID=2804960 RepID=A0ACC1TGA6_9AGAR|nr:hypothetical protein F5876DRAFT_84438 [Lentinula aff. lateritia]
MGWANIDEDIDSNGFIEDVKVSHAPYVYGEENVVYYGEEKKDENGELQHGLVRTQIPVAPLFTAIEHGVTGQHSKSILKDMTDGLKSFLSFYGVLSRADLGGKCWITEKVPVMPRPLATAPFLMSSCLVTTRTAPVSAICSHNPHRSTSVPPQDIPSTIFSFLDTSNS